MINYNVDNKKLQIIFKIYMGGKYERRLTKKQEQQAEQEMTKIDLSKGNVYGKRLEAPVLGNYYKLPERTTGRHDFTLDTSFAYVCFESYVL